MTTRNYLMNNEIFHVAIKHKVYEWCIDVIFKHIVRNFPQKARRVPKVGEKYIYIKEPTIEETYYNCLIIEPSELEDYDLLDEAEKQDLVFAIRYKTLIYRTEEGEEIEVSTDEDNDDEEKEDGFQYFTTTEMETLIFKQ